MLPTVIAAMLALAPGFKEPPTPPSPPAAVASDSGYLMTASVLLQTTPGIQEVIPTDEEWPKLGAAIHKLAVDWEILDVRETRYVMSRQVDFSSDLNLLRHRYQKLKNAPLVADSFRFPERQEANDLVQFNRAFLKHLEQRHELETDRSQELRAVMKETTRLYLIWDAVRDARCEFYYITVRREALLKLKNMIGDEDYYAGKLPPNVPLWRFNELQ